MPRESKLHYWENKNLWYANKDRKKYYCPHPDGARKPKKSPEGKWSPVPKQVKDWFRDLMAKALKPVSTDSVAAIMDEALVWHQENRAKRTFERYRDFCSDFCQEYGNLPISELTSRHVTQWLQSKDSWGPTTKRNAIIALNRMLNFAVKNLGLAHNPCRGMDKPKANTRTDYITSEEFDAIIAKVPDQEFKDLLVLSFDTGARPQETKGLRADQVDVPNRRAVIKRDEAKKEIQRAIYFGTERSWEIIRRLMKKYPKGALLRNTKGRPWTGFAIKNRFEDMEEEVGKRLTHYLLRHSHITMGLARGVDSHVMAKLVGHQSTAMLDKHYSHIAQDAKEMLKAAMKAAGNGTDEPSSEQEAE